MNIDKRKAGYAACLIVALLVANAVHAQSTATPTKTPATQATSAPAEGPDALFARWDTNHDKLLSADEFRAGWQQLQTVRALHEQFVAHDTNKNGCLNAAEYAQLTLIKNAGPAAPPMAQFDVQKNQCLDFKEYVGVIDYMLKHQHK
jgi:hypothetical protein